MTKIFDIGHEDLSSC